MIKFRKLNSILTQMEFDVEDRTKSRMMLDAIRSRFTSLDPSARFVRFGSGEICPISAMGNFATPLLLEIAAGAKALFPEENIDVDAELVPIFRPNLSDCIISEPQNEEIKLRDYQREAANQMLKYGRGILKVPTRGGKSLILYTVISSIFAYRKTMKTAFLMVPNTQLINQMYDDFNNYGIKGKFDVVKFSSKNTEPPKEIKGKQLIISNRQWLQEHLDELPKKIDVVFVDECHSCSVGGFATKFTKMFKTNYKFGMTATDSDNMKNVWNTRKLFGPVVYEVPFEVLEENGFVAKPQVIPIEVFYKNGVEFFQGQHRELDYDESGNLMNMDDDQQENGYILESQFLAQSIDFNSIITKLIDGVLKDGNCLILFDRTMHGRILFDMIKNKNKFYIDGSVKVEDRQKITQILQKNNHAALVAQSATMGVGLTIKSLNSVFLVNLKSASTATLQGIGRGLMIEEGKDRLRIFDVFASGNGNNFKYSKRHRKNRQHLLSDYYKCEEEKIRKIEVD